MNAARRGLGGWFLLTFVAGGFACSEPAPPVPLVPPSAAVSDAAPAPPEGAVIVKPQTVVAGCTMCMFKQVPAKGCLWAVELDGVVRLVEGDALPKDHVNHGPEGMCNVKREATVEGWLDGDAFVASRFELLPFEPGKHAQPDGPAH